MFRALGLGLCLALLAAPAMADNQPGSDIGGTGRIEPRGGVVMLGGPPGAIIRAIAVRVGDVVKRGQLLVTLDDSGARADQQIAQLAYDQAKLAGQQSIAAEAGAVQLAQTRFQQAQADADAYVALGPTATSQRQIANANTAALEAKTALASERAKEKQIRAAAAADSGSAALRLKQANDKLAL